MAKFLKTTCFLLLAGIMMLSGIFLQTMPATQAASQFMDYFQAMPIIGSLSSSCWGAAAVGPRDQSNGLEDKTMTQYCYWDGGIIKGSDGLYHMFASRWAQSGGHNGWFGSVAVHATSSNLYGPYTDKGLCWPNNQNGKGHNVFPFVGGDGKFYIIVADTRPGDIFQATSLNGPWTQLGTISTSGNFGQLANISVMYRPDGRYMAVPRSGVIGISNNVLGTYVVQGTSAYVQAGVPSGNLEDPVVWYSGGKYHIVVNKWDTRKAYHITSTDGINGWKLDTGLAYDPTANFLRYTNGTVNRWNKLERFNVYIENGHIVAGMFAAIDVAKDQDLGNDSHGSKVIVVPFDGTSFDGGPTPTPTRPGPTPTPTPPGTISIACGSSSAVGSFSADQYYSGGTTYNNTNTVDISQITSNPPPAALFNNERYGAMSYTIPGFTSGSSYTVTLYFAETYLTASGKRLFSVSLNGATVLSNFDIYASAGGQNKAIARSFTATANSSGQIVIQFISGTENPKINGISIKPGGSTPTPTPTRVVNTPTPTLGGGSISIAAGSTSAVGSFQADQYYSGGSTYRNSNTVDVSQITSNPPPAALFNNERYGAMSYTIPGFTSGSSYTVTLYFAETFLTASGKRLFSVSINGSTVISNFDIYASAGGQNKAIARSFTTTANSNGQIVIQFISGTENPKINGISIR